MASRTVRPAVARQAPGSCAGRARRQGYPGDDMPVRTETDKAQLARAIELAGRGTGLVKPNPVVGAVVARDGEVLGEGWHERYGGAHAEVNAIEACGLADLSGT